MWAAELLRTDQLFILSVSVDPALAKVSIRTVSVQGWVFGRTKLRREDKRSKNESNTVDLKQSLPVVGDKTHTTDNKTSLLYVVFLKVLW